VSAVRSVVSVPLRDSVRQLGAWLSTPIAVPAAEPADGEEAGAAAPAPAVLGPLDIKDTIKALIGAVATAVGVVGLLTVVGGAVTWLRFRELGLPAQTAVALMPKDDLVNLGATGMVIFVGIGILVVAALFALDPSGRVTPGTLVALVFLFVGLLVYVYLEDDFQTRSKLTLGVLAFLLVLASLQVARLTGVRFIPVGVAVFFAVLIFGGAWTYRYESDNTKAQPAAVLRGDEKKGLIGYFVAD
jgi:hypothetical protein